MKNFNLFGFSGSKTHVTRGAKSLVTRGAKSLVFKGTRTYVFGGVKALLLALTLLCGVGNVWGLSKTYSKGNLNTCKDNQYVKSFEHCSIQISGDNSIKYDNSKEALDLGSSPKTTKNFTISWSSNTGTKMVVSKITVSAYMYNAVIGVSCDLNLNGVKKSVKAAVVSYTDVSCDVSASVTSIPMSITRSNNQDYSLFIQSITIEYTLTPDAPNVKSSPASVNVSLSESSPVLLNLTDYFSVADETDFRPLVVYSSSTGGNITGTNFYSLKAGSYTVTSSINAKVNCHVASGQSNPLTINVNRFNPSGTLSTTTGEVDLSVESTKNYFDLRSCISDFVGDDNWNCQIVSTTASSTSKGGIDGGYNFYGTESGNYVIKVQTATTDRYNEKDFGNVTITVKSKAVPVFTPSGFSEGTTNEVNVYDNLQLEVKNVSDGLTGDFKPINYDANYLEITRNGNTITIKPLKYFENKSVTFTQTDNTTYQGASVTYKFKANRITPTITWTPASGSLNWNGTMEASVTSNSNGTLSYEVQTSTLGKYDGEKIYAYNTSGTFTVRASTTLTDQYAAGYQDINITISKPANHLEMNINSQAAYNNYKTSATDVSYNSDNIEFAHKGLFAQQDKRTIIFSFAGVPQYLSFRATSEATGLSNPIWHWYGKKKGSSEFVEIANKKDSKDFTITNHPLDPGIEQIKFEYYDVQNLGHIYNLKVTERSEVTGTESIAFGSKLKADAAKEQTATINWYNVLPLTLSIEGTNADQFELVSPTSINAGLDQYGENVQVKVKYKGTAIGSHSAKLVFKDINGATKKEITLSGTTQEVYYATAYAEARPNTSANIGQIFVTCNASTPGESTPWITSDKKDSSTNTADRGTTSTGSANITAEYYAQELPGYKFAGWYSDDACTAKVSDGDASDRNKYTETITTSATVEPYPTITRYAKFDAVTVSAAAAQTVNFTTSGTQTATLTFAVTNADNNDDFNAPVVSGDAGWTISNWSYANNVVTVNLSFTATENTTTMGDHIATVNLTAKSNNSATGQVTATVNMTPAYTCNINGEYYVEAENNSLDLQTLWTSSSKGTITYEIVNFTAAGGAQDGATAPAISNNRYLSLGKAGTLELKLTQQAGTSSAAGEATKTVIIKRNPNPLTVTIANLETLERYVGLDDTYTINATSANTRTKVLITPNTSNPTPVLPPLPAAEGSLTFTTGLDEGDITFTISQAQDYKYEGINETATVHVGQGNVCTIYEALSETNRNTTLYIPGNNQTFTAGTGHIISFAAKRTNGNTGDITLDEYMGNTRQKQTTLHLTGEYQKFIYEIGSTTNQIRLTGMNAVNATFKDLMVTKYTTITPHNGQPLNMSKIKGEADLDSIITITHNTCGEIKVQVSGANADMFIVTAVQGQANTYKVTYKKSDIAGTHTANITFYDHNTKATMTVTGTTTEMQDPVWKCDIADSYNVEQTTLDLQALWTSNQSDAAPYSARQYSIVFTPDGDNHDGATGVNLTENRYLTLGDAGTVKITMTQAANAFYYAKTETKEVTINRLANAMTFTLNGVAGATSSSMNLGEGMMTYINTTNTKDTIYAEQTDGFKSGTYYRDWNAVYAAATTGNVVVRAWQDQTYKYEAAEGSFTITVKEMPMTQCKALEQASLTLNGKYSDPIPPVYTSVLNVTGEPSSTMTFSVQATNPGNADTTRWWMEYSVDNETWTKLYAPETKATTTRNNVTIDNFPIDAKYVRFGMEKAAAWESGTIWTNQNVTQLTFTNISISRATYLKVGANEASVTEGDITLNEPTNPITIYSGESVERNFVIAYSTCDQTEYDHIRIQCNRGAAAQFSEDNINTETANNGVHTITLTYTPTVWCSADTLDTVVVAVYNRSVRRRVTMYVKVLPYTLNSGDWNVTSNWADGKKPEGDKYGVVVAGDATLNENATVGSIEVASGKTLTIAHDKKLTVDGSTQPLKPATDLGNIRVQADATLLVKAGSLNINKLDLEGGLYGSVGNFGVPYVQLNSTASIYRNNTEVDYYLNVLPSSYYAFAVPFEVPFENIGYAQNASVTYDKANYHGSAIDIRLYNGAARATENTSTANNSKYWESLLDEQGKLKVGQGYIISARKLKGANFAELKLTMNVDNAWLTGGEQGQVGDDVRNAMAVKKNAGSGSTRWNNKGWNFIANPFLSSNKIASEQLTLLYAQDSVGKWGDFKPNTEAIKYVTLPNYDMSDYNQISATELGDELQPFMPFFIQAAETGTLQFNSVHEYAAPARWNARPTSTYPEQRIYLSLRGNEMKESLGLMIQEDYTAEYDYNADLVKMLGEANTLRGYLTHGNNDMAYLALNETLAEEAIPMTVRIPAMNLYTWSLKESSRTDMLDAVYLTDVVENKVINLLNEDYTFSANEGLLQGRFFLNAVLNPNRQPTDIRDAANEKDEDAQKMIFRNHLYIVHKGIVYDGQGQRIMQIKK